MGAGNAARGAAKIKSPALLTSVMMPRRDSPLCIALMNCPGAAGTFVTILAIGVGLLTFSWFFLI
jgi:hypothetical protein